MMIATMVVVSEEEMKRMNKTSVLMKDGSGYVGYLEAHHMLHCVVCQGSKQSPKRIRG
jgi:hypothetical protein